MRSLHTIKDIQIIDGAGSWPTKSGGKLNVLFGIPFDLLSDKYFHYELSEIKKLTSDIQGLRAYIVSNLKNGSIGANEWHKIRSEMVFVLSGKVRWDSEDIYGSKHSVILQKNIGVWIPPYILHTYTALDDYVKILVLANTLFNAEDPSTQDTYSTELFRQLQAEMKSEHRSPTD